MTDGFEFVEYTAADTQELAALFEAMGFTAIARHRSKDVLLYRQGEINFILNRETDSFAQSFAKVHGPSVCAFALRTPDAAEMYARVQRLGAKPFHGHIGPMELDIPAIQGIGHSLIYLVDRYGERSIYDVDFLPLAGRDQQPRGAGLRAIDHLTHNVHTGRMDHWAEFYMRLFAFREIRYFDIHGRATGLKSRALMSPCGKIRIPINEPADSKSQVQEYLEAYHGEGIQHIALQTDDVYAAVEALRARGVAFMDVADAYYDDVERRLPDCGEDVGRLRAARVLIDGTTRPSPRLLLQIFTRPVIGPILFEIIQRKGDEGFGEGNFQALFEAIERDQQRRGVL
jgi:4-hydroxyphenylpyruvate dioxygenase